MNTIQLLLLVTLIVHAGGKRKLYDDLKCEENNDLISSMRKGFHYFLENAKKTVKAFFNIVGSSETKFLFAHLPDSVAFDPERKTVLIIHGYTTKHNGVLINDLKLAILTSQDVNLILVDWGHHSIRLSYFQSVQETLGVADDIVRFLQDYQQYVNSSNGMWTNLHFIGHSLGAHISGQVGYKLKNSSFTVERITGLDPAQPCFRRVTPRLKLDRSDAEFVDIIHSQTGYGKGLRGFGLRKPHGHADFYVNGGVMQPECNSIPYVSPILQQLSFYRKSSKDLYLAVCSHNIAVKFFTSSVIISQNPNKGFWAYRWNPKSYEDAIKILDQREIETKQHENVDCSRCARMGYNASAYHRGSFIVFTSLVPAGRYRLRLDDFPQIKDSINLMLPNKKASSNNLLRQLLDFINVSAGRVSAKYRDYFGLYKDYY